MAEAKIIAYCGKSGDGQQATRIAALLQSGLWDLVTPDDRRLFTVEGVCHDTPGGRAIRQFLTALYQGVSQQS